MSRAHQNVCVWKGGGGLRTNKMRLAAKTGRQPCYPAVPPTWCRDKSRNNAARHRQHQIDSLRRPSEAWRGVAAKAVRTRLPAGSIPLGALPKAGKARQAWQTEHKNGNSIRATRSASLSLVGTKNIIKNPGLPFSSARRDGLVRRGLRLLRCLAFCSQCTCLRAAGPCRAVQTVAVQAALPTNRPGHLPRGRP